MAEFGSFEWKGDEFLRDLEEAMRPGMDAAGIAVAEGIRSGIMRQGTPTSPSGVANLRSGVRRIVRRALGQTVSNSAAGRRNEATARSILNAGGLVDPPGGMPRLRTGSLARSILSVREANSHELGTRVGSGLKYADVHEFGATIKPKTAKLLSWLGIDGKRIFAKSVTIPARPFMRPGFMKSKTAAFEAFVAEVQRRMSAKGGGK